MPNYECLASFGNLDRKSLCKEHESVMPVASPRIVDVIGSFTKPGLSDNVGGVKHFSSTRLHALGEERHFALVEGVAFPTVGSLVIHSGQDTRSDPCISSVTTLIMITTSNSYSERGAGCPINFSMFYGTPWPGSSWPACEPNFFTCS